MENTDREVNVDEIMRRIREEVARRKKVSETSGGGFNQKGNEEFMRGANRRVFEREADADGLSHHMRSNRIGSMPRSEKLESFPNSPENKANEAYYEMERIALPRLPESLEKIELKTHYTVENFLKLDDEDFIRNAYRAIVRREADNSGLLFYLNSLRTGSFSKIEILGRLRFSREGRAHRIQVAGLLPKYILRRTSHLPVLRYLYAISKLAFRLPRLLEKLQQFDAIVVQQQRERVAQFNGLVTRIEASFHTIQEHVASQSEKIRRDLKRANVDIVDSKQILLKKADSFQIADLENRLAEGLAQKADNKVVGELENRLAEGLAQKADNKVVGELDNRLAEGLVQKADNKAVGELDNRLAEGLVQKADNKAVGELENRLAEGLVQKADTQETWKRFREIEDQIMDHKRNIVDQQRRLAMLLEEVRKRLPKFIDQNQIGIMAAEEHHLLDALYVSLEDHFRGTREDIKSRSEVYLPMVRDRKVGTDKAPILDIGCGRGEWLELLKDNELVAKGIDLNRVMVDECLERGLDVVEADAFTYLQNLRTNSFGAITGLHIIEHIPFNRLVGFFDEVLRVIKPGGMCIFETPNPENLVVAAYSFYIDPTHVRPLPPPTIRFLAEARGFIETRIERIHAELLPNRPMWDYVNGQAIDDITDVKRIIQSTLFSAPDYALVAYKA
jgi:SAM-dependent methyltransferase